MIGVDYVQYFWLLFVFLAFYLIGRHDEDIGPLTGVIMGAVIVGAHIYVGGSNTYLLLYGAGGYALLWMYKLLLSNPTTLSGKEERNEES